MPASKADLFAYFNQLGIAHETVAHRPIFTVEDGHGVWPLVKGLHCKNLFLKDKKDKIWLVVMPAELRADLARLEKTIGAARVSFGKPELLLEVLGVTPGSVTPFALINDVNKRATVVLDRNMLQSTFVNYHPLHNDHSTTIKSSDLLKFIHELGYEPLIVDCGNATISSVA